jgi:hypothetical protein
MIRSTCEVFLTAKTGWHRTEWLVDQKSLSRWHIGAHEFFDGTQVTTNFYIGTGVKASTSLHVFDMHLQLTQQHCSKFQFMKVLIQFIIIQHQYDMLKLCTKKFSALLTSCACQTRISSLHNHCSWYY